MDFFPSPNKKATPKKTKQYKKREIDLCIGIYYLGNNEWHDIHTFPIIHDIYEILLKKSLKENVLIINMKSNSARGSEVINKTEGSINCDVLCDSVYKFPSFRIYIQKMIVYMEEYIFLHYYNVYTVKSMYD